MSWLKKYWKWIGGLALVALAVWWFFFRKKGAAASKKVAGLVIEPSDDEISVTAMDGVNALTNTPTSIGGG